MKFTDHELIWIKVVMEERYTEYAESLAYEESNKQYEEAELTKSLMADTKAVIDKIKNELNI